MLSMAIRINVMLHILKIGLTSGTAKHALRQSKVYGAQKKLLTFLKDTNCGPNWLVR